MKDRNTVEKTEDDELLERIIEKAKEGESIDGNDYIELTIEVL